MTYEAVIGLEVHAQLKTKTKMFCRCENAFGREPNTLTCPVCLAMPGALPVTNRAAILFAIRTGLALQCTVQQKSIFARKNYFYPDLPKGYQISQFDEPICVNGKMELVTEGGTKTVGIVRAHLEEDAGKLLHGDNLLTIEGSLVDLNRAGVPLIEIVGAPDLRTSHEAAAYLKKLRAILRYIDVCDGNMEEGSFRCDANVSIRPVGTSEMGLRVEIKNMNSFKHVQKAIEYEIERQTEAKERGEPIAQETRLWNPDKGITTSMRSKEQAHDYRYFPDPDLFTLSFSPDLIEETRKTLPELPDQRRQRFQQEYKLPPYDADTLTAEKELSDYFEEAVNQYGKEPQKAKSISNYVLGDLLRLANERNESIKDLKIRPVHLAKLLQTIEQGTISGKMGKEVLDEMANTGASPDEIISKTGLSQISDPTTIRNAIREVMAQSPNQLTQYRSGKDKLFGFFVGQVMKATQGKANPSILNELLKEELSRDV